MQKISILGCGWLGKPLAIALLKEGHIVKGSTTSLEKINELRSIGILPSVINIKHTEGYLDFLQSTILIISITCKDVTAFKKLMSYIEKSSIKKIIFISSTSVYNRNNKIITEEDAVLQTPLIEIENLFRNSTYFKSTILRFSGLYGEERHPANWFKDRKIPQPNGFVNMIHLTDCIEIIKKIIAADYWNTTLNACCNHHPTRREFYTAAKKSKGLPMPLFEENDVYEWKIISSQKLQNILEYTFIYDNLLQF